MLINLSCLTENCEQNFLEGEKAQVSCLLEVLGSQIGNSEKKAGYRFWNSEGMGG